MPFLRSARKNISDRLHLKSYSSLIFSISNLPSHISLSPPSASSPSVIYLSVCSLSFISPWSINTKLLLSLLDQFQVSSWPVQLNDTHLPHTWLSSPSLQRPRLPSWPYMGEFISEGTWKVALTERDNRFMNHVWCKRPSPSHTDFILLFSSISAAGLKGHCVCKSYPDPCIFSNADHIIFNVLGVFFTTIKNLHKSCNQSQVCIHFCQCLTVW